MGFSLLTACIVENSNLIECSIQDASITDGGGHATTVLEKVSSITLAALRAGGWAADDVIEGGATGRADVSAKLIMAVLLRASVC